MRELFEHDEEDSDPPTLITTILKVFTGKKRILAIDDDPRMARFIKLYIERHLNSEVVPTSDQAEFETLVKEEKWDCLVMDVIMAPETGPDLAYRAVPKHIPILFTSGSSEVPAREDYKRIKSTHNIKGIVTKPYYGTGLSDAVFEACK